jgi:hypothetical protein
MAKAIFDATIKLVLKTVFDKSTNMPLLDEDGKQVKKPVWHRDTLKTQYVLPGTLTYEQALQQFAEADASGSWLKSDTYKTKAGQSVAYIPFEDEVVEQHDMKVSGSIKTRTAVVNNYVDIPEEEI